MRLGISCKFNSANFKIFQTLFKTIQTERQTDWDAYPSLALETGCSSASSSGRRAWGGGFPWWSGDSPCCGPMAWTSFPRFLSSSPIGWNTEPSDKWHCNKPQNKTIIINQEYDWIAKRVVVIITKEGGGLSKIANQIISTPTPFWGYKKKDFINYSEISFLKADKVRYLNDR